MERNLEVIRAILESYKLNGQDDQAGICERFQFGDFEYNYHVALLMDIGYIKCNNKIGRYITWQGHDYLESLS